MWLARQRALNPAQFASRLVRHLKTKVVVMGLLILAILTWAAVYSLPDGRLHVRFMDVGQGDAILVTTPFRIGSTAQYSLGSATGGISQKGHLGIRSEVRFNSRFRKTLL
jgi:beta-lactamase superfamily II metal-dependent hydrolase